APGGGRHDRLGSGDAAAPPAGAAGARHGPGPGDHRPGGHGGPARGDHGRVRGRDRRGRLGRVLYESNIRAGPERTAGRNRRRTRVVRVSSPFSPPAGVIMIHRLFPRSRQLWKTMSKFFEESGPEFAVSMRGYDRHQVDEFTARLHQNIQACEQQCGEVRSASDAAEIQLRRAEARIAALERRIAERAERIAEREQPTLAGLGTRVEKLLRVSEQEAAAQREDVGRRAAAMRAEAQAEAESVMRSARAEAAEAVAAAERDVVEIRFRAVSEAAELRENARRNHDLARADAERETQAAQAQARSEAEKA